MQLNHAYIPLPDDGAESLAGRVPLRTFAVVRPNADARFSIPESSNDIERYIYNLLTREEQRICDTATD
jgi:hypothetical protein